MIDSRVQTDDQAQADYELPARFEEALLSLRRTSRPRGLILDEVPAPRRLAPFAAALTAETVDTQGGAPVASGRFVVLHDPEGQEAWGGDFRVVAMARARIDAEVGTDPALSAAAWSWLSEALERQGAGYRALVGTVTRVLSETFGGLELTDTCGHAEIRASWSPVSPDLEPHLAAWYELIHVAAGHEPERATVLTLAELIR